jgi:hypothetical protein
MHGELRPCGRRTSYSADAFRSDDHEAEQHLGDSDEVMQLDGVERIGYLSAEYVSLKLCDHKLTIDCEMVTGRACDDGWLLRNPGLEDGGL